MRIEVGEELEFGDGRHETNLRGIAAVALAGIAATTLGVWTWQFVNRSGGPSTKTAGPLPRIAVLRFDSSRSDPRDNAINNVLANALIGSLNGRPRVVVLPAAILQSSVNSGAIDPLAAGRDLGVNAIVFGNLQRSGGRLRVDVRLVSTRAGRQLWADRFEGDSSGISGLSKLISESMARHLTALLD